MLRFVRYVCRVPAEFGPTGPVKSSGVEMPELWTKEMVKVTETAYRNWLARRPGQPEELLTEEKWNKYKAELKAGIVANVYAVLGRPGEDGPQGKGEAEEGKGRRVGAASELAEMMKGSGERVMVWWRDTLEGRIDTLLKKAHMPVWCNAALQDEIQSWHDVGPALSQVSLDWLPSRP